MTAAAMTAHAVLLTLAAMAIEPKPAEDQRVAPIEMVFSAQPLATAAEAASLLEDEQIAPTPQPSPQARAEPAPALPASLLAAGPIAEPVPDPSPPELSPPEPQKPEPAPGNPVVSTPARPPAAASTVRAPPPRPTLRAVPAPVRVVPVPSKSPISPAPAQPVPAPTRAEAPATPAAAPAPAAVSGAWRSALASWLQSRKRYPDEARRQRDEGQVTVRFIVGRDGQVTEALIVRGSGSDSLDRAALASLRDGRAPPFPVDMSQPQVTTTVTFRYRLEE